MNTLHCGPTIIQSQEALVLAIVLIRMRQFMIFLSMRAYLTTCFHPYHSQLKIHNYFVIYQSDRCNVNR
jgi:predicted transposase YdaD